VLEAMRDITWDCTCVLITSDKAYENVEWIWGYRENDRLGGKDIYSGSKGAAELIINSYRHSFLKNMPHLKLGIARAGNVIGGGDWAPDRLVVDCIKALANREIVEIRYPNAIRPWQHVLEPLSGYLTLGQYLHEGLVPNGEAFNFGPPAKETKTVLELTHDLLKLWGLDPEKFIKITDESPFNESTLLKLNCDKALSLLHWHSTLNYEQCINMIVDWYRACYEKTTDNMYQLTVNQINEYNFLNEQTVNYWRNRFYRTKPFTGNYLPISQNKDFDTE